MWIPLVLAGSAAAAVSVGCRATLAARSQLFGRVLFRGPRTDPPRMTLTFDDGPHEFATQGILDILRKHDVSATFFVVGRTAADHPHLITRMHQEGHSIGNHSMDHSFGGLFHGDRYWMDQINRTDDVIERIIGVRTAMFRPPMGFKTFHLTRAARKTGHMLVTWTRRGRDGVPTSARHIIRRLANSTQAGDIVLLHDGVVKPVRRDPQATVDALRFLLDTWRDRGIALVRLDELLNVSAYQQVRHASDSALSFASQVS